MYVAPRPRKEDDPLFAVRIAVTAAISCLIAMLLQTPMPMFIPALCIGLLAGIRKGFDIKKAIGGPVILMLVLSFFAFIVKITHPMPMLVLLLNSLFVILAYYITLKTGNQFGMLILVGVTLMSVMGLDSYYQMIMTLSAFVEALGITLLMLPLMHFLIPTRSKEPLVEIYTPDPYNYHWQRVLIRTGIMIGLLLFLYLFLGSANLMLAVGAIFTLMFPTKETRYIEAFERSSSTLIGGSMALIILSIVAFIGHVEIVLLLITAAALFLGNKMMYGRLPPMVYQFALTTMVVLIMGGLSSQDPIYATLLRIILVIIGSIGSAFLSSLLEQILLPNLKA